MVGKLRNEGMMIYENRTSAGVSYRVGTLRKRNRCWSNGVIRCGLLSVTQNEEGVFVALSYFSKPKGFYDR